MAPAQVEKRKKKTYGGQFFGFVPFTAVVGCDFHVATLKRVALVYGD